MEIRKRLSIPVVILVWACCVSEVVGAQVSHTLPDLNIIFGVWTPGSEPLQVLDFKMRTLLIQSDRELLQHALPGGRVDITGGDSGGATAESPRMIVLFTGRVADTVKLLEPSTGAILYIQDGGQFRAYPPDVQTASDGLQFTPDPARADSVRYMRRGVEAGQVFIGGTGGTPGAQARSAAPARSLTAPTRVRYVAPTYPVQAAQANIQGVVVVEIHIDASGHVTQARVIRSLPFLDQAAIDAVLKWEYTPATVDGVPQPIVITVGVEVRPNGG